MSWEQTKNISVVIKRCRNGFIVEPVRADGSEVPDEETMVFTAKGNVTGGIGQKSEDTLFGFLDNLFPYKTEFKVEPSIQPVTKDEFGNA